MATETHTASDLAAMLDEHPGPLEPVATIIERLTGRRPSPSSVWRWTRKGNAVAGRLPARLLFGSQHSTEAVVREWIARKSEYVPRPPRPSGPSDDDLRRRGLLE